MRIKNWFFKYLPKRKSPIKEIIFEDDFDDSVIIKTRDPQTDVLSSITTEVPIEYEQGTVSDRKASITFNGALNFRVTNAVIPRKPNANTPFKCRVQLKISKISSGFGNVTRLAQIMRLRLSSNWKNLEQFPKKITWCTIWELWCQNSDRHAGQFRINIGVGKYPGVNKPLLFHVEAQNMDTGKIVWSGYSDKYVLKYATWMPIRIRYYQKEGSNGVFRIESFNPNTTEYTTIFEHIGWMFNPSYPQQPVKHFSCCKIYTSDEIIEAIKGDDPTASVNITFDDVKIVR